MDYLLWTHVLVPARKGLVFAIARGYSIPPHIVGEGRGRDSFPGWNIVEEVLDGYCC